MKNNFFQSIKCHTFLEPQALSDLNDDEDDDDDDDDNDDDDGTSVGEVIDNWLGGWS